MVELSLHFAIKHFLMTCFLNMAKLDGQYTHPVPTIANFSQNKYSEKILPNLSFDICRLNTTIIDVLKIRLL